MLSLQPLIQIFILAFNRPNYFLQTLTSVLNQRFTDYEVIVSDNSTDNRTENALRNISDDKLLYLRRKPSLPPLDHFNTVLKEVKSEYFMIFHDDDIMEPNCLQTLYDLIKKNSTSVAVGGNASIFWNDRKIRAGKFITKRSSTTLISTPEQLAKIYLTHKDLAPFSSYLYRRSSVKEIELNAKEGGKHADVSFLLKILEKGTIKWTYQCVMQYRKHSLQDSQASNLGDSKKLIRYICQKTPIHKNSYEIHYYRYKSWAGKLKSEFFNSRGKINSRRLQKIYCAVFRFSPFDIFFKLFCWQIYALIKNQTKVQE